MLDAIVTASGEPSARIDTLGAWVQGSLLAEDPTAAQCAEAMERAVEAGGRTVLFEITSRALLARIACRWPPEVAVLTNVTREHLGDHGTFDNYLAAASAGKDPVALAYGSIKALPEFAGARDA